MLELRAGDTDRAAIRAPRRIRNAVPHLWSSFWLCDFRVRASATMRTPAFRRGLVRFSSPLTKQAAYTPYARELEEGFNPTVHPCSPRMGYLRHLVPTCTKLARVF